jgi:hypothetical protein
MREVVIASLAGDNGWPFFSGFSSHWFRQFCLDGRVELRAGRNPNAIVDDGDAYGRRYLLEGVV